MLIPLWKSTARCPPLVLAVPFALPTPSLWAKVLIVGQWKSLDQPHIFSGQGGGGRVWPFPTWVQHKSGGGMFPCSPLPAADGRGLLSALRPALVLPCRGKCLPALRLRGMPREQQPLRNQVEM